MTRRGDEPSEMTQPPTPLDDADVEALLRGRVPVERPDLAALGTLLAAARETGAVSPAPRGELAALLSEGFDPAARPAPAISVPAWGAAPDRSRAVGLLRRRAAHLAGLSVAVQLVLFGGVAVAGVTTAAGAGALPEPLQRRMATVISVLTPFTVPDPAPAPGPKPAEAPAVATTPKPARTGEPRVDKTESEPVAPVVEPAPTTPKVAEVQKPTPTPTPLPVPTPTPTEAPIVDPPTPDPTGTPSPTGDPTQEPSGETAAPEEPAPEESTSDDVEAAPGRSDGKGSKVEPATSPEPSPEPAA